MSSKDIAKSVAAQIIPSSSEIFWSAFKNYIEQKLNGKTEKQESSKPKEQVNVNKPKSF